MKKIMLLGLSLLITTTLFAQKVVPKIKEGSVLNFNVDYQGQEIDFALTITSLADPVKMDWNVQGAGGSYEMAHKALDAGNVFNASTPVMNGVTKMKENETFCFISRAAYQSLLKSKAFTYSALNFVLKDTDAFKVGTQNLDASHVATADGKTEIWILNNPDLPVVLKIKGNQNGVDFYATGIKE